MEQITSMIITHKRASLDVIEKAWHGDVQALLQKIYSVKGISECFVIQTCNRVELYIVSPEGEAILRRIAEQMHVPDRIVVFHNHEQSMRHLLRLACGLESMIVGEDQILGQLKDFYLLAQRAGTIGKVLSTALDKATAVGKRARKETGINRGAVSIGSAAVELVEEIFSTLDGKNLMVIGTGEMGSLAARAASHRNLKQIFIVSRTFAKAEYLAKELNGTAVEFSRIAEFLPKSDVVICATSAPHPVITPKLISDCLDNNKKLLIIDIGTPRNVDEAVSRLPNIELHNIDSLRVISERNLENRQIEALKVEKIIEEELSALDDQFKQQIADRVIAALYQRAEEIRKRELEKACHKLNTARCVDPGEIEILEALTNSIVSKILVEPTRALRGAARDNDEQFIESIEKLFKLDENHDETRKHKDAKTEKSESTENC